MRTGYSALPLSYGPVSRADGIRTRDLYLRKVTDSLRPTAADYNVL
jgi:hypothetical protein